MTNTPAPYSVIDNRTGEIVPTGQMMIVPIRDKVREAWVMTFQEGLMELAEDQDMTGQTLRVLLAALAAMDYENRLHVTQAMVARRLNIPRQRVGEAFKMLEAKGIIERHAETMTHTAGYTVNPGYVWKGRARTLKEERARRINRTLQESVDKAEEQQRLHAKR